MRIATRRAVPHLAVWTLLLTLGVAPAQDDPKPGDAPPKPTPVVAFFSSSVAFDLKAKFNVKVTPITQEPTYLASLSTRINNENSFYSYLHNPTEKPHTVNVYLEAGDESPRVLIGQTATPIEVGPLQTLRFDLSPAKPATPPVAVPAAAGEKLKDGEPEAFKPRGVKLPPGMKYLYIRALASNAKLGTAVVTENSKVEVNDKAPEFEYDIKSSNNSVTVVVTYEAKARRLSNSPVKIRLDMRPDLNGQLIPKSLLKGTFEAELPALEDKDAKVTATLIAEGVQFKSGSTESVATLAVTTDGYSRDLVFKTDFNGKDTKLFGESKPSNVRLSAKFQEQGKPVTVSVEAEDKPVELLIDRVGDGMKFETLRKFATDRSRELYLHVGDDGVIGLTPVVKDWTVEFPTAQVAGKRAFAVRVAGGEPSPRQTLTIDRTPPEGVRFVAPLPKAVLPVSTEIGLVAEGSDPDSDIASVFFFTGETPPGPDGKPAAGSRVIPGDAVKDKPGTYKSKELLRLPEAKGELRLGVVFFNRVGLSTVADMTQYVSVPPLPGADKPTTGSIIGRAVQAGRPQPGLPVTLSDAAGKVVKETKSDDAGKFEFKELAPGNYTVVAVKRIDANASGKATVEVKAAKEPTQIPALVIKR